MVVEDFRTFSEWLLPGLGQLGALVIFIISVSLIAWAGLFFSYIVAAIQLGPVEGFYAVARVLLSAVRNDLPGLSARRTWAIARLAIHESIRRWVLVVFVVFVLVILFAGWFLDTKTENPAALYISFVMTSSSYLMIALGILLSTFSIPNDIKNRTIYTVITKPVRSGEIVLGRILGFTLIGTAMLVPMCLVSLGFVYRGISHSHDLEPDSEVAINNPDAGQPGEPDILGHEGSTTYDMHHQHTFTVRRDEGDDSPDAVEVGETDPEHGHVHSVVRNADGSYEIGPPRDALQARVPIYGKLRFLNREGQPGEGILVGDEWQYRKYIEGGSLAEAIWTFEGLREEDFPNGLPVELTLRVFRTRKADIVSGVAGEIWLRNPNPAVNIETRKDFFQAKEYQVDRRFFDRELDAAIDPLNPASRQGKKLDLFRDLVHDGKLELRIRCADQGQYYGMASADAYLRARDGSFVVNFIKGYVGIWMQMVLVICFGVSFSTFLSGPVAFQATGTGMILGHFVRFVIQLARGTIEGGGPIESMIRMLKQQNVALDLDVDRRVALVVENIDRVFMFFLELTARLFPRFGDFNMGETVANGFNIPADLFARQLATMAAYSLVVAVIGYFALKSREIAA